LAEPDGIAPRAPHLAVVEPGNLTHHLIDGGIDRETLVVITFFRAQDVPGRYQCELGDEDFAFAALSLGAQLELGINDALVDAVEPGYLLYDVVLQVAGELDIVGLNLKIHADTS
jgi:hypothetical protein